MTVSDDIVAMAAEIARLRLQLAVSEADKVSALAALRIEVETLDYQREWHRETSDWYAELYEFAPIAYVALDSTGLIRDINLTGATLLGRERQRLIGRPMRLHVVPEDRRLFLEHVYRCRDATEQVVTELHILTAKEEALPVEIISRRAVGDGPASLRTAIFDLRERKQADHDLLLGHQRLSLALLASEAGLYEFTVPHGRTRVSARWAEILGLPAVDQEDAQLGDWLTARVHPEDLLARSDAKAAFLANETYTYVAEFRVRRRDDVSIWVRELAHAAQRGKDGRPSHVVGVLLDISDEKRRLVEAERRTAQLRELAAALYRVEENERRELATLLHDDLGQRLVAAQLQLTMITRRAGGPPPEGFASVVQILTGAQETVRSLSFQLSPPILHELGLVAAVQWLASEMAESLQLDVEIEVDDVMPPLRGNPDYLLFRCIRELLLNVAKHAGVASARVVMRSPPDTAYYQISVEDHGVGFAAAGLARNRPHARSFGLLSVYERIEGLGGRVVVESGPGEGTQVLLLLPLAMLG